MPPPNLANTAIAARLVRARIAAGFATLKAAAIRLDTSVETYTRHEQGKAAVRPVELKRYASVFGVSHGWLSTGVGTGSKASSTKLGQGAEEPTADRPENGEEMPFADKAAAGKQGRKPLC